MHHSRRVLVHFHLDSLWFGSDTSRNRFIPVIDVIYLSYVIKGLSCVFQIRFGSFYLVLNHRLYRDFSDRFVFWVILLSKLKYWSCSCVFTVEKSNHYVRQVEISAISHSLYRGFSYCFVFWVIFCRN
jgi:hypothetical protein